MTAKVKAGAHPVYVENLFDFFGMKRFFFSPAFVSRKKKSRGLGLSNAGDCGENEFSTASLYNNVRWIEIDWAVRAPADVSFINNQQRTLLASGLYNFLSFLNWILTNLYASTRAWIETSTSLLGIWFIYLLFILLCIWKLKCWEAEMLMWEGLTTICCAELTRIQNSSQAWITERLFIVVLHLQKHSEVVRLVRQSDLRD